MPSPGTWLADILIRPYEPADQREVEAICYRTGFNGRDLAGTGLLGDRRLFALIFVLYYAWYEPEHFLVAEDRTTGQLAGYLCGATDTVAQEERFRRRMHWRLLLRGLLVTSWRYPEAWRLARHLRRLPGPDPDRHREMVARFPAHLHVDLLPAYHRRGIGTRLLSVFEEHLVALGVGGLHLGTSSANLEAVPFYQSRGFQLWDSWPASFWPGAQGDKTLIFVKELPGDHKPVAMRSEMV